MLVVAGAEGLEPSTVGFGDRCSTIRTMPLQISACIIYKYLPFVKTFTKIFFNFLKLLQKIADN